MPVLENVIDTLPEAYAVLLVQEPKIGSIPFAEAEILLVSDRSVSVVFVPVHPAIIPNTNVKLNNSMNETFITKLVLVG